MTGSNDVVPIAPSLEPTLESTGVHYQPPEDRHRVVVLSALALVAAGAAAVAAELLIAMIAAITNLCFHQRWDLGEATPIGHSLGFLVALVPVAGGLIVGLMARFGSSAIRGHGIPEAMERVLHGESRISPRVTFRGRVAHVSE